VSGPLPVLAAGCAEPPARTYDVALLDLDGVVYVGPDAVPGVPASLEAARAEGMRLGYVTNNASRTPEQVAAHLTEIGVPASTEEVITSSQAAASAVRERLGGGARVLPVGGPGVAAALAAAGLTVVRSAEDDPLAVVQGYGRDVGWEELAEAVVAVRRGAWHLATNTDATIPSPRGPLPGNGALVGVVAGVTGRAPESTGKPDPAMHAECVRRTGARRPIVVGDRLDTDIEGARRAGAAGLLVLTGVSGAGDLLAAAPHRRPDLVSQDTGGLLVAHPEVTSDRGGWRCGAWWARAADAGNAFTLAAHRPAGGGGSGEPHDGPRSDGLDGLDGVHGLDGLRALAVAVWVAHPDGAPSDIRVLPADDGATEALERWELPRG
jgi:glycerol-1-phosphatase